MRPLERPESGSLAYDATLPKPGAFPAFYEAYRARNDFTMAVGEDWFRAQLFEAFAAGWEAAMLDHEC